ncbi:MAG: PAS domain S-box protein [Verrucomicrobiota bacterium]|nr:PAS domain S-box protein [Verrucomicrobiota bacterium]
METDDAGEEKRLRSAALQNANAILLARQRAERELLEVKEALERKTGELAQSLAMMRATLESTTDGILVTNANGEVTDFNQKFVEMWRIPHELMASKEHRQLLTATSANFKDPEAFRTRIAQIYASSPPETHDLLELADGRVIERFSKTQLIEERGVGRVWSFRDITDRKRAEREMREQSEWFSVTLGSIGDAVITVDVDCRITFLNPVAEKLTGWPKADAVGQRVVDVIRIVNEATRETAANPIHRALAQGIVIGLANHTTLIRRDGGEIPIEDSAAPIKNPAGAIIGAVMVFHDVTERRQKELALERSYQAEQAVRAVAEQANLAKDHFIAALSHELRTPLTPVLAILSSLRDQAAIPAALAEDLETVRRNVELEARLIDDLLDLTRIARGKLHLRYEDVSARQIIEDAISTCLPDLKAKRLKLEREFPASRRTIRADSARVTQILWNLLKNSIKFTPPEGTITVRSRIAAGSGSDERLIIEIQDSGIGMEPRDVDRVFQAFEQGDLSIARQFGGLGLGLAISKAIAESHHGSLHAISAGKGCGSIFTLTLPCGEREELQVLDLPSTHATSPTTMSAPLAGDSGRPLRILLVEDHADTAAILSKLLRGMGHDVLHADTVRRAHEIADREMHNGGIDLLMSDLGLPDGSGRDLMRTLAAKYELKGIALSGYGMDSDLDQSNTAGFARHLIKPIDVSLLRRTISELMND